MFICHLFYFLLLPFFKKNPLQPGPRSDCPVVDGPRADNVVVVVVVVAFGGFLIHLTCLSSPREAGQELVSLLAVGQNHCTLSDKLQRSERGREGISTPHALVELMHLAP